MCKYCDVEMMQEDLMTHEIPLFGLPKDECTAELSVWISENNDMVLTLDHVNGTSIDNGELRRVKIKYCPMCGEKLK